MHCLIYCSKTRKDLGVADLKNILEVAQMKNKEHGITGILFYNAQYFIQCLEGERRALNDTYQRIAKDGRHTDIFLLSYIKIDYREFGDWSMGIASSKSVNQQVFLKYLPTPEFDPYQLSFNGARDFLVELKNTAKIHASVE